MNSCYIECIRNWKIYLWDQLENDEQLNFAYLDAKYNSTRFAYHNNVVVMHATTRHVLRVCLW